MKTQYDLSGNDWMLSGWIPWLWRLQQTMEIGAATDAEIGTFPAKVPGSIQYSLQKAGLLPDWNIGVNHRECEWVENRHWIYEMVIPEGMIKSGKKYRLRCMGLDYKGFITLNGVEVGKFCGTHVPYTFDLTPQLNNERNILRVIFDLPPRWLGQIGYTSQVKEWKVRFNYTWDWIPRTVQIGIWDDIFIEETDGVEIEDFRCVADADVKSSTGMLTLSGRVTPSKSGKVLAKLSKDGSVIKEEEIPVSEFNALGISWKGLDVDLWWPNLEGDQPLYDVEFTLLDENGVEQDSVSRRVGFRNVAWEQCEGSPENADPWLCVINGKPVFLQGVNFPPMLPNFADVTEEDYRKLISLYKELGVNIFRINGVGFLEKEMFYNLCDEAGITVWQDIPLSSSGIDNVAPDDDDSVNGIAKIAESFAARRQHHPSLIVWCGGNELQYNKDGIGIPLDLTHPMIKRMSEVFAKHDPTRRFLETTSSGPRFYAQPDDFGKGLHWDVHGPWKMDGDFAKWKDYWSRDDALFRSETGAPGAASVELIRQYKGDLPELPISIENALWRRPVGWWIESWTFNQEMGREPQTLEEYVEWSQKRQADALTIAVKACKDRFPRCGGVMLWTGHDCFPCAANTSIIDFHREPKPAALALAKVWRGE
ncbi:MAG: glycoside hydrolase family 2 protein [Armatimonadota bacterium]